MTAPCCTIQLELHHCHKDNYNICQKYCPTEIRAVLKSFLCSNNRYTVARENGAMRHFRNTITESYSKAVLMLSESLAGDYFEDR